MADLRSGTTIGGYLVVTHRNIDDTNTTSNRAIWSAKKSEQVRATLAQDIIDTVESIDIIDKLGYTPANKAGDTFTGDVTARTFKLPNVNPSSPINRYTLFDSGSYRYGMTLWNTDGTSGTWGTMLYTSAGQRISFGKVNNASFSSHSHITEMGYFNADDDSLNIKKLNVDGDIYLESGHQIIGRGGDISIKHEASTARLVFSTNGHFYFSNTFGGESFSRIEVQATTGKIGLGSGTSDRDTWIERSGVNTLKISDNLLVNKSFSITTGNGIIGGSNFNNGWIKLGSASSGLALDTNEIMTFGHDLLLGTSTSHDIYLKASNSNKVVVKHDGKVGIGTDTPTSMLHIVNNSTGDSVADESGILLEGTHATHGETALMFKNIGTGSSRWYTGLNQGNLLGIGYGTSFTDAGTFFAITTTGNIGIGRVDPSFKLDVNGNARITNNLTVGTGSSGINLVNGKLWSTSNALQLIGTGTAGAWIGNSENNPDIIVKDRKVGVGIQLPLYKFQVQNSIGGFSYNAVFNNLNNTNGSISAIGFSVDGSNIINVAKGAIAFERVSNYSVGRMHFLLNNTQSVGDATLADKRMTIHNDGLVEIIGKSLKLGSGSTSSNFDGMGFSHLSTMRFMNNEKYFIGAGNAYWYLNSANNGTAIKHHDLLLTTSSNSASGTETGITFGVAENTTGTDGYRLGRWYARTSSATSILYIDGKLGVGITPESNYKVHVSGDVRISNASNSSLNGKIVGNLEGYVLPTNTNEFNFVGSGTAHMFYRGAGSAISLITFSNGLGTGTRTTLEALRFKSTATTGTSPLQVSSTTVVTNLNADMLDGKHASEIMNWTNITNKPDPRITLTGAVEGTGVMTDMNSVSIKTENVKIENTAQTKKYSLKYNEEYNSLDFVFES